MSDNTPEEKDSPTFTVRSDAVENEWKLDKLTESFLQIPRSAVAGLAVAVAGLFLAALIGFAPNPDQSHAAEPLPFQPSPRPTQKPPERDPQLPTNPAMRSYALKSYSDSQEFVYLPGYDQTRALVNPIPATAASIQRGRTNYERNCAACHAFDGQPRPNLAKPPRNLANPHEYVYGSSEAAIYRSIAHGIPNSSMGAYGKVIEDKKIWDIVNYVRSLQR